MENNKSKSRIRKFAFSILRILAAVYVGLTLFLFFFQSSFIYRPSKEIIGAPKNLGLDYNEVIFGTEDGVALYGWHIPFNGAKQAILFCHSNAGNISYYLEAIQFFNGLGRNVFIFDYRGYGRSEGKTSELGTYLDAEAAWNYLVKEKHFSPENIIVVGRSLGAAVAVNLAKKHKPRVLIIESAFTKYEDIAAIRFPLIPVGLISRYRYDVGGAIAEIDCPVLVVHSRDDEIVPFSQGKRVFDVAGAPKEFLAISGSHIDGYVTDGKKYSEGITNFLNKYAASR